MKKIESESLEVLKIFTSENSADMLTRVEPRDKIELCKELVVIHSSYMPSISSFRRMGLEEEIFGVHSINEII